MKYLALPLILMFLLFSGCDLLDDDDDDSSDGGTEVVATNGSSATATTTSSTVVLEAFSDFSCSSGWTNRDGALGLSPHSGSGTCQATFPGAVGNYNVTITVQTEFDGTSPYALYINDAGAASGSYPLAPGCGSDCHPDDWRSQCPDRNVNIDAGNHKVSTGDVIKFYGAEDWNCGDHGAYAKWHKITFTRI
ncbi:MAG: hypothetical protein QTN59_20280 [Candidatus Electrothrix communis]|nr:hypothetical protein [Desulfobulbus sp. US4]WLE96999.1 MAG: hypothetical protein QTN59_20280 [Candidatus Electrothrix communis]